MTMKYTFILILTLTFYSCSIGKLKFDRIDYYCGNNSLPPNYREMLEIKIDSSQIKITKRKGEDVDNNEVDKYDPLDKIIADEGYDDVLEE